MKKTPVTLKTLTLAATAATFTLASTPAANAVAIDDWYSPPGTTTIDNYFLHPVTNNRPDWLYIGDSGTPAIVDIVSGGSIDSTGRGIIGYAGCPGTVNVYEGGSFISSHTYVGAYQFTTGYLNVFGGSVEIYSLAIGQDPVIFDSGSGFVTVAGATGQLRVESYTDNYGELVVSDNANAVFYYSFYNYGKLSVSDNANVYVSALLNAPFGSVELTNGGVLEASTFQVDDVWSPIFIGYDSLLKVDAAFIINQATEFTFAVSPTDTAGKIQLDNVSFIVYEESSLTILAEGEFAEGEQILILDGTPVDGLWGYDPVIADTGQVFDISYDEFNAGVYETYFVARAIPEPSTYALIGGVGVLALAALRRRRKGL